MKNFPVQKRLQLNKHWAQNIVTDHAADAKVSDLVIQSVNLGTTTRLKVRVTHDAPEILPLSWFVKTPSLVLKSRLITALPGLLRKEIYFYQSFAKTAPLKLPPVLAAHNRFGQGSTLVMSDLSELGYIPGQPKDTLSLQQAQRVVEDLAKFHGYFSDKHNLLKSHRWLTDFNSAAENHLGSLLALPLMKRGLRLSGELIPDKLHKPALHYAANRRKIMKFLANGKQTLVHHDCHPGNLFWKGAEPGFLDWQLVRTGEGIGDIAYFLATALDSNLRRVHEKYLLDIYLTNMQQQGVEGLNRQNLYQRYRAHLSYALEAMVVTLAIGDMMDYESNLELIRRSVSAVEDHDSYGSLNY